MRLWRTAWWRRQPRRESFTEVWYRTLSRRVVELTADGVDEKSAAQRAAEAGQRALGQMAPELADRLIRESPAEARRLRRQHNAFKRRPRVYWGSSLDLMWSMIDHHENLGAHYTQNKDQPEPHPRPVLENALSSLHARACRTAFEVHHLLATGLGSGALARCRTLHEIAVTATVLNDYSRKPEHADLAERFIRHADAVRFSEATTYDEHAEALGFPPLSPEDVAAARTDRDELRVRFGADFDSENGWAIGLDGKSGKVTFRALEKLSGIDHLRPYYRFSSHQVHGGSRGAAFTTVSQGGREVKLSGYSNADVTDPAQLALISLHQVTTATLLSADLPQPGDVLMLEVLSTMLDEALAELGRAQDRLDDDEDRVLAGLDAPARLARVRDVIRAGKARITSRGQV